MPGVPLYSARRRVLVEEIERELGDGCAILALTGRVVDKPEE